jgi:branched-chain amino acid transport system permease protein
MRDKLQKNAPALVLIGLMALFPFAISVLTGESIDSGTPKFWQGMLAQVFILAVYAISYDLLMGYTGILSFGHAMFFGVGGYVVGILLKHVGWSLPVATVAVILTAVVLSLLIGVTALRVQGVYLTMVTLAFAQMIFVISEATDFREWTGAEDGLQGIPVPAWLSPTQQRLIFYFVSLAFCIVSYYVVRRITQSPMGRVFVAIRENELRARAIGYNTFVYKLVAMVTAGVMAALAGMMNALWNLNANPNMLATSTTINALLMTIIGGAGTLSGPLLGAAFIHLLGYGLNVVFGPRWPLLFGLVYVGIVLFLPYGFMGAWRGWLAKRKRG